MNKTEIISILSTNGLKITPQRVAVYEAVKKLDHPPADDILKAVNRYHPGIAKGTVYNILEVFCKKGILIKVKTEGDKMRYDAITELHHHLYDEGSDKIIDYKDEELNRLLENYFKTKNIPDFNIKEIKLQLTGNTINKNKKS